jgi:hypothetical protein
MNILPQSETETLPLENPTTEYCIYCLEPMAGHVCAVTPEERIESIPLSYCTCEIAVGVDTGCPVHGDCTCTPELPDGRWTACPHCRKVSDYYFDQLIPF